MSEPSGAVGPGVGRTGRGVARERRAGWTGPAGGRALGPEVGGRMAGGPGAQGRGLVGGRMVGGRGRRAVGWWVDGWWGSDGHPAGGGPCVLRPREANEWWVAPTHGMPAVTGQRASRQSSRRGAGVRAVAGWAAGDPARGPGGCGRTARRVLRAAVQPGPQGGAGLGHAFTPHGPRALVEPPGLGGVDEGELLGHGASIRRGCDSLGLHGRVDRHKSPAHAPDQVGPGGAGGPRPDGRAGGQRSDGATGGRPAGRERRGRSVTRGRRGPPAARVARARRCGPGPGAGRPGGGGR
jgi:translation initiation factor IF-2